MSKPFAVVGKILVIAAWAAAFSLMFWAAVIPALLQNLSPGGIPSSLRHPLFWFLALSLPLIALAWFRGRFFCWRICPVGLLQDLFPSRGRAGADPRNLAVFLFLLGFAITGANLLIAFDPLVIFNRAISSAGMRGPRAWIFILPLFTVLALSLWRKRFWCFKLCPLGAFFDWVLWLRTHRSRRWFLWERHSCRDRCSPGSRPKNKPRISRILANLFGRQTNPIREDSRLKGPGQAEADPGHPASRPECRSRQASDPGRRNFLLLLGGGLAGGLAWRRLNRRGGRIDPRIIRPPGALPEDEFTETCVRCGACLAVCLTKTLAPTIAGAGWEGFLTPRLVPRIGECDEFCNRCGQSCPTQAIRGMPLAAKRMAKLGTARVAKERCLAWAYDKHCLVCQEFCPYLAIRTLKNENGTDSPEVIAERCRGCGICEKKCRSDPSPAILVYNDGAGTWASDPVS